MPAIGTSLTNQAGTCGKDDIILPLDPIHLWEALRYTELNPLRARLVSEAELWAWSSAASHCGGKEHEEYLALDAWRRYWTAATWREYLEEGEIESKLAIIRQRTQAGPWGTRSLFKISRRRRNGS